MAVTSPLIYAELAAFRASGALVFGGAAFDKTAWAIATAVASWVPTVLLTGIVLGTAGSGAIPAVTTRVTVAPNSPLMISGLASAGMVGSLSASLGVVVGLAIPSALTKFAQYAGVSSGVGIGTDASKVVQANPASLYSLLLPVLGPGLAAPQMALGLSRGISSLVMTGTGAGTVVGSASPSSASGTSTSVMV